MTRVDTVAAANLLRRLRESRGWSWAELARALRDCAGKLRLSSLQGRQVGSIQRAIARWESPSERTNPGQHYQVLLAHLYAHRADGALALGPGSDFEMLVEALRGFGVTEQRVEALVEMVTRTATAPANRATAESDEELVNQVDAAVTRINAQIGSAPLVRLQLALAPSVQTCRQFLNPPRSSLDKDRALVAVNALGLAARLAFETKDDETANSLYAEAVAAAGRLSDRRHRAAIRTSYAMVTLHATGNLARARELAQAAVVDAGDSATHRARAQAVHAEVNARAGHAHRARAVLDTAWNAVARLPPAERLAGFNADRLDGFDGLCALHLDDAQRANDLLERSLTTLTGSRESVQRGIVTTDLALARLQLGDPVACGQLLHETVELAATTGGRVPAQRVGHARRALRHAGAQEVVIELDDHLHERLLGH